MNTSTINIPSPVWWSPLTTSILDLEKLRSKQLIGEIPSHIFFQLKDIFHILETLWSARIEWNNTTLSEYIEKVIENTPEDERSKEIQNLDRAIQFIEQNTQYESTIDRAYISHLHQIVTDWLQHEWSRTPWSLRDCNVKVSDHIPPDFLVLPEHFQYFINFINADHQAQNQLLMVAIAHHRFAYIHPFDNGNWRMWRLLTYALLIKLWFKVKNWRIINPSSVFYTDRKKYYDMLAQADSLNDDDIRDRSEYFLSWLKNEVVKIDSLLSSDYVREKILWPTLSYARTREHITEMEEKILRHLIKQPDMQMKAQSLSDIGIKESRMKSYYMKWLRDKSILRSTTKDWRIYTINFMNNYLLRAIINILTQEWFVSDFLENNN